MAAADLPDLLFHHRVLAIGGAVLVALAYLLHKLSRYNARARKARVLGCEPPPKYPHVEPVLGIDLYLKTSKAKREHRLLQDAQERFNKYGNTFQMNCMGQNIIQTCEPGNVKAILATNFDNFSLGSRRKAAFIPLLGHGIFTTDDAAWEHSRLLLRPNFTRAQIANLSTLENNVRELLDLIPTNGTTVDLQDLFFRLTIDSATDFLFGESCHSLSPSIISCDSIASAFPAAFNFCQHAISDSARLGPLAQYIPDATFARNNKIVHAFVDRYVQRALAYRRAVAGAEKDAKDTTERYVFLYELAKDTDDPTRLASELLNILLAGRDTTASLLSNLWFVLARRPDVYAKLREEVDAVCGRNAPTFAQLKDMKYLRYCLNESLRLHPVVPVNSRTATTDTVIPLGGGPHGTSPVFVAAGTMVGYSVYVMHRRKDIYGADAEEFRPERWESLRVGWEYLPFNGGPRICLGQQFALTEAGYTTTRLVQSFGAIKGRDETEWIENLHLTCATSTGVNVVLERR